MGLCVQQSNELKLFGKELAEIQAEQRRQGEELKQVIHLLGEVQRELSKIQDEVRPKLSHIKIGFSSSNAKGAHMPSNFTEGPITLTVAGQTVQAIVDGYDQFGNPMPSDGSFTMPQISWTIDNEDFATAVQNDDGSASITAVATGVANLTATVKSAEGVDLSDTETVTISIPVTPPPASVLSSIKIAFSTPVSSDASRRR